MPLIEDIPVNPGADFNARTTYSFKCVSNTDNGFIYV